jgi:hypothetical protein
MSLSGLGPSEVVYWQSIPSSGSASTVWKNVLGQPYHKTAELVHVMRWVYIGKQGARRIAGKDLAWMLMHMKG